jgi:pyruvate dehydrogenase E2 component (dihydrolipoamide acetyltransferase)
MATAVIMPRQGQSVESCLIGKWYKHKGDKVSVGDLLFTYETDKATFDEIAKTDGVLLAIFFEEGDDVECLKNVCVIGATGDDISAFSQGGSASVAAVTGTLVDVAPPLAAATTGSAILAQDTGITESNIVSHDMGKTENAILAQDTGITESTTAFQAAETLARSTTNEIRGGIKISPRAQILAERSGAVLENATASGPGGRVIERDVMALIKKGQILTPAARASETPRAGGIGAGINIGAGAGTGIGVGTGTRIGVGAGSGIDAAVGAGASTGAGAGTGIGTGIGGRIRLSDLETSGAKAKSAEGDEWQIVKLSNIRKTIARTMLHSLANSAQLTLNASFDATDILGFRKKAKLVAAESWLSAVTITDIIVYAVSRAIINHKNLNAHYLEDNTMKVFRNAHIGVAVDTTRGLLVPTIFNANTMTLSGISSRAKELYSLSIKGDISPDLIQGASFTISNMGTLGIESFTPVLNPPQTGILGVCSIIERFKGGTPYPAMGLSLTFDHRAMDGADGARFLKELVAFLENFSVFAVIG